MATSLCFFLCFAVFATFCISLGLFVGGFYPIYTMENSDAMKNDTCNNQFDGCTYNSRSNMYYCTCTLTSIEYDVGSIVIPCNYNYGQVMPPVMPCYINRCSPSFSQYDFYLNNCSFVERNFYGIFTDQQLNATAYLVVGSISGFIFLVVLVAIAVMMFRR